ncbi:MAG: hypothetical protein MO846_07560 [Candidatus Devosia symbiotica]|nr:hypothetical protein [Candidatus Devosia symbiotica]
MLATAISVVLISFGSVVGLNFVNFDYSTDVNPIIVDIVAASWFLWVQISSFMAGGYLAGRLRRHHFDANKHESDLRDGTHGLLVWGNAVILDTVIAIGSIGTAASTAGSIAAASSIIAQDDAALAPDGYAIDTIVPFQLADAD